MSSGHKERKDGTMLKLTQVFQSLREYVIRADGMYVFFPMTLNFHFSVLLP